MNQPPSESLTHGSGVPSGAPERFDPATMRGGTIEAEHLARYRFAAQLVEGRSVLDAGSGWGYGSEILKLAGASRVVGVDIAASIVEAASALASPGVTFEVGDIQALEFPDDSFDVIVCFEAIEHVERWPDTLDGFARVLKPDGQLIISTPNDPAYGDRNEHHIHQFTRNEFRAVLGERFDSVELFAQSPWITSLICDLETSESANVEVDLARTAKNVAAEAGTEIYLIAVAGAANSQALKPAATLASAAEFKEWIERWDEQHTYIHSLQNELGLHRTQEADALRSEILRLSALLAERETSVLEARRHCAEADERIARMQGATSWRVTAPLRNNRLLRKLTGRDTMR